MCLRERLSAEATGRLSKQWKEKRLYALGVLERGLRSGNHSGSDGEFVSTPRTRALPYPVFERRYFFFLPISLIS